MSVGWVGATVRGRALLQRCAGPSAARAIAEAGSWDAGRRQLAATPYGGRVPERASRATARHAAAAATLWQVRVLAGWLPPNATGLARLAAGPFEIANIEARVAELIGTRPVGAVDPFALGSLGAAWPHIAGARTIDEVRSMLASSVWGDPGSTDEASIALGLRVGWARRLARLSPLTRPWGDGMLAVLVARERFAFERQIAEPTARQIGRALGRGWRSASTSGELATGIPETASWPFAGIDDTDLWRAELAIVRRVTADAEPIARSGRDGRDTVVAVLAMLLVDVWRLGAAIEGAGRGAVAGEVLDAIAA